MMADPPFLADWKIANQIIAQNGMQTGISTDAISTRGMPYLHTIRVDRRRSVSIRSVMRFTVVLSLAILVSRSGSKELNSVDHAFS
jgi:hypothetical protein